MRTEGITFDADGNLFVSAIDSEADDQLLSVTTEGTFAPAAESESILGLESDPSGIIAAAIATGELLLIDPATGNVDPIATGLGAPNFVVTTPWDTMFVSDDSIGEDTIDEVTWDGDVSTWVAGVPTPNGMVFSLDERTLYVTSLLETQLWRVGTGIAGIEKYLGEKNEREGNHRGHALHEQDRRVRRDSTVESCQRHAGEQEHLQRERRIGARDEKAQREAGREEAVVKPLVRREGF
jgi:hypothetical protein